MRARLVVIFLVRFEQIAKVAVAKHEDMVKAFPSDRSDEPLRTSVLPGRSWCDRPISDAHGSKSAEKGMAIGAIPVADDTLRSPLPPVCLSQLMGNPFRAWMRRYTQPQKRRVCCRIKNPYNSRNEIVGTRNRSIDATPSA